MSNSVPQPEPALIVIGIGADGAAGLGDAARRALGSAQVVIGSARQLDLVIGAHSALTIPLPSPVFPALLDLLDRHSGDCVALLASGDPMFHGIGGSLARRGRMPDLVLPAPSSVSLAAARMGWAWEDVAVVSAVGRPIERMVPRLAPGRRMLLLTFGPWGARDAREALRGAGYGASPITVLSALGGPDESVTPLAGDEAHDPLSILAIDCVADAPSVVRGVGAALPDEDFETDGQITKQEIRAITIARLVPAPGQLLWDIGAGSGSIGIEWLLAAPDSAAIAIDPREDRARRAERNALRLGAPDLRVIVGRAPEALAGLPAPDAVFIGGGLTAPGLLDAAIAAVRVGGRVVANAVTIEGETILASCHARLGGELTRIALQRAGAIGGFAGWRPAMPITQWTWRRETQ